MPKVSIITLTYNSSRYIEDLLKGINELRGKDSEVIVADNASGDDTLKLVKKFGKNIAIVETEGNVGFSKGNNAAAARATGEYLLFLNPDTKFESGSLSDMVAIIENNIGVGIVGGKMMSVDGRPEKSAGKFFTLFSSILIATGLDERFGVRVSPNKTTRVDFVSGGFMLIKSSLFERLRGFDENFFMYIEDMEICFRAKLAGYETYFFPGIVITHIGQGSSNRGFAIKNIYKGILYFHKKHGTPFSYFVVSLVFKMKAVALVMLGKIMNNNYLKETYSAALKA